MIVISFHLNYLSFISINDKGEKKIVEKTGILDFPIDFNNKLLNDGNIESFFEEILKKIKNNLNYHDNNFLISIPTKMVLFDLNTIDFNTNFQSISKLNNMTSQVKYGQKIVNSFKKRVYPFYDEKDIVSLLSVSFNEDFISRIEMYFRKNNYKLNGVFVNILTSLNTIMKLVNKNIKSFSLISYNDDNEIEFIKVKNNIITIYLRYKKTAGDNIVYYVKSGEYSKGMIELLKKDINEKYFQYTDKIYLVGSRKQQDKIKYIANKISFAEVINPFDIFKNSNSMMLGKNLPSYYYNDNVFVATTGLIL
ncbi:MAG: hypothetical protein U9N76_04645 [Candidatus Marinimicrobia bacterium]|nr:hypothetical protein [Candidatus Neomarinimicrobiota bacterium]